MSKPQETPVRLRTRHWYDGSSRDNYIHRSWMKRGLPDDSFSGKPMIGICNSASDLAPCNQHLRELAEFVKRGVWEAGGIPLEFPVTSLGETQIQPTAMLLRNLMAMDVEESVRCNPIDGVVLLSGCDKTTPAMLMGASSVDLPAIMLTGGPMLTGRHKGQPAWIGNGHVENERGRSRTNNEPRRICCNRIIHDSKCRSLQSNGNGFDNGSDGGSSWNDVVSKCGHPSPRYPSKTISPSHWAKNC